jgi:ABC-type transport system involved in multi-copper enzyme maturation permease subunit
MSGSMTTASRSTGRAKPKQGACHAAGLIARKEAGELVGAVRGRIWLLMLALALSVFGLLLVSDTELSLLDNAQVVYDMTGIVTVLGALLAVIVGTDAIAGERERGSLIPLMLAPISPNGILAGKIGGQAIAWLTALLLAIPYLWAVGSTGQNLYAGAAGLILLGTPVVLGFGFLAMGLGAWAGSTRSSLMIATIILLVSSSPLLLGPSLLQSAIGRAFDAVNPLSHALNAYDAVIIDSQGLAAQWVHAVATLLWLALTLWFAAASIRNFARYGRFR